MDPVIKTTAFRHLRKFPICGRCGKARRRATNARTLRPTPRPARRFVPDALGVGTLWTSFVVAPTYWQEHPLVCHLGVTPKGEATLAKIVAASHDVRVPGYCLGMGSAFDIFHRLAMLAIAYVVIAALVVVDSSSED